MQQPSWIEELFRREDEFTAARNEEITRMRSNGSVVVFGAGATSAQVVEQLHGLGIAPTAFCDNDSRKVGLSICGLPVISFARLCAEYSRSFIYISTQMYYREISNQLFSHGFLEESVARHDLIVQLPWESSFESYFRKNADSFAALHDEFADDESRDVLVRRCAYLLSRNRSFLSEIHRANQYFERDIVKAEANAVFVDIGVFTGDTVEKYLSFCGGGGIDIFTVLNPMQKCIRQLPAISPECGI